MAIPTSGIEIARHGFGVDGYYIKEFVYPSTVAKENFSKDCAAGSTAQTIDETAHAIAGYFFYDGSAWNDV